MNEGERGKERKKERKRKKSSAKLKEKINTISGIKLRIIFFVFLLCHKSETFL